MFEVANETILHASPPRVWTALTSFEEFKRWNPYVRPSGPAAPEAVVQYSFRMNPKARFWTVDALLIECEQQVRLVFRFGFGWFLSFEEDYAIYPDPVGSKLIHTFRCTGVLSKLRLKNMKRNFRAMLDVTDRMLQRHLSRVRSKQIPTKRKVRRGFRPDHS